MAVTDRKPLNLSLFVEKWGDIETRIEDFLVFYVLYLQSREEFPFWDEYEHGIYPERSKLLSCLPVLRGIVLAAPSTTGLLIAAMPMADSYYFFNANNDTGIAENIVRWYAWGLRHQLKSSYPIPILEGLVELYEKHIWIRPFLYKALNEAYVVQTLECCRFKENCWELYKIVDKIEFLFSGDSIIEILKGTTSPTSILVFGSHPVLLKHPKLQKKWLHAFIKEPVIHNSCTKYYITDEVLYSLPPYHARHLAEHIAEHMRKQHNITVCLNLQTLIEKCTACAIFESDKEAIEYLQQHKNEWQQPAIQTVC